MPTQSLPRYFYPLPVRFADTDAQTHVFFGNYFTYFDEAYMGYLEEIGCSWGRLAEHGLETYYVSADCEFLGRAYYGQILNVHAAFTRLGNSSLRLELTIVNTTNDSVVAKGHLIAVMIDSAEDRPTTIPDWFRQAVERYQGESAGAG